jgi:hypothetical protein
MKKGTLIYLAVAAALYYYWIKRKKATGPVAPSAEAAASTARQIVSNIVDNTTFLPDDTTFAKEYANDKKNCR